MRGGRDLSRVQAKDEDVVAASRWGVESRQVDGEQLRIRRAKLRAARLGRWAVLVVAALSLKGTAVVKTRKDALKRGSGGAERRAREPNTLEAARSALLRLKILGLAAPHDSRVAPERGGQHALEGGVAEGVDLFGSD